ncbi:hypothetical protein CYMTET_28908, partial [Cymbomonas tetramitiformis]
MPPKEDNEELLEGHDLADCPCPEVDIESSWRDDIEEFERGMQTDPVGTGVASTQSLTVGEIETQTDDHMMTQVASGVSSEMILPFLNRVMPMMEACLSEMDASDAFVEPEMNDDHMATVDVVHNLSMFNKAMDDQNPEDLKTTGVSWNSTGYVLAVSYGRFDVSGWCNSPGALCSWNL